MREKPILFSGPMVRAILDGRDGPRRRLYVCKGEDPNSPNHLAMRLANGLDEADSEKCWVWTRCCNQYGYGTLTVAGRTVLAHRLAYELAIGEIGEGLDVMHSCDNPKCINPAHLEAGTRSKNMRDCHIRGRSRIPKVRMVGERNGSAKLTGENVLDIRGRLLSGDTQQVIAEDFGVSQSTISNIKLGRKWNA